VVEAGVDAFKVLTCQPLATLDPACAAGTVGITTPGGPEDVFRINFQTGGAARRVDIPVGGTILPQMVTPSLSPGPAPFVIFGTVGVPTSSDQVILPLLIGTMCFHVSILDPTNPALFILADNLTNGPALLPSTPTNWIAVVGGLTSPVQVTLQGIILEDGVQLRTTNAIILNVQ
jgi:hypothetical protein